MKKFLATIIAISFTLLISNVSVYALTPDDLDSSDVNQNRIQDSEIFAISEFPSFDYVADCLNRYAEEEFETTKVKTALAIRSLNNHQDLQFHIFSDRNSEDYKRLINLIDESCDFIQICGLVDTSALKATRLAFENNALEATLSFIIPMDEESTIKEKTYEQLKTHNIPIYWKITENSSDVFTLEVAIGKYVIQPGDTLSEIALEHQTTVDKLLECNSNILNPDSICAGDYLVIK